MLSKWAPILAEATAKLSERERMAVGLLADINKTNPSSIALKRAGFKTFAELHKTAAQAHAKLRSMLLTIGLTSIDDLALEQRGSSWEGGLPEASKATTIRNEQQEPESTKKPETIKKPKPIKTTAATKVETVKKPERRGRPRILAPCSVDGCTGSYHAKGLCSLHYNRMLKTGTVNLKGWTGRPKNLSGCLVDGCDRDFYGRGYCKRHYQRLLATGSPIKPQKRCLHEACELPHYAKGVCQQHYYRDYRRNKTTEDTQTQTRAAGF
jgi:hypothetical protein